MSTRDFLSKDAFDPLANEILVLRNETEEFRDEAEQSAEDALTAFLNLFGVRLVGLVEGVGNLPASGSGGDAFGITDSGTIEQFAVWNVADEDWDVADFPFGIGIPLPIGANPFASDPASFTATGFVEKGINPFIY